MRASVSVRVSNKVWRVFDGFKKYISALPTSNQKVKQTESKIERYARNELLVDTIVFEEFS